MIFQAIKKSKKSIKTNNENWITFIEKVIYNNVKNWSRKTSNSNFDKREKEKQNHYNFVRQNRKISQKSSQKKINEYTNKIFEIEIQIKNDLIKIINFIIISNFKKYVILRNKWKKSLFETLILENKTTKNIESQTIQLLTYKNLLHIELKMSSTTNHVNIQNIDKKMKEAKKIWKTQI